MTKVRHPGSLPPAAMAINSAILTYRNQTNQWPNPKKQKLQLGDFRYKQLKAAYSTSRITHTQGFLLEICNQDSMAVRIV